MASTVRPSCDNFWENTSVRSRSIAEVSNTPPPRPAPSGGRLLPVGRFFGVPLYFAPSWILIAALITATYGGVVYDAVDGLTRSVSYLVALAFAVALALCVLLHELGHV